MVLLGANLSVRARRDPASTENSPSGRGAGGGVGTGRWRTLVRLGWTASDGTLESPTGFFAATGGQLYIFVARRVEPFPSGSLLESSPRPGCA